MWCFYDITRNTLKRIYASSGVDNLTCFDFRQPPHEVNLRPVVQLVYMVTVTSHATDLSVSEIAKDGKYGWNMVILNAILCILFNLPVQVNNECPPSHLS